MKLSVVIPTLNEAACIRETIGRMRQAAECEIVVVDGGSDDDTLAQAEAADLCLSARRGRAAQQNAGAAASTGDVLMFLHADCWPEPGAGVAIAAALSNTSVVGGCFTQSIDADAIGYRLLERGNALRARLWQWTYGDQGLFVRRDVFERVGGFPDLELMEDLYLAKRLKAEGRLTLLPHRLHVSPRRWQQQGLVRQTLRNWTFIGLSHCGISAATLARHYADVR